MDHKFNESLLACEVIKYGAFHGAQHAQCTAPSIGLDGVSPPVKRQSAAEKVPRRALATTERAGEGDAEINSRREGGARGT